MAPVGDLVRGFEQKISDSGTAVEMYMKCKPDSEESRAQYVKASPQALLPVTFPTLIVYGDADKDVPTAYLEPYAKEAQAGAPELVSLVCVPGVGHFEIVNAAHAAFLEGAVPAAAALLDRHVDAGAAA